MVDTCRNSPKMVKAARRTGWPLVERVPKIGPPRRYRYPTPRTTSDFEHRTERGDSPTAERDK
jgi:hypothetical protein